MPTEHTHAVDAGESEGFPTVVLSSSEGLAAAFAPGVGMACCSLTNDGAELLGLRGGLRKYAEQGSSMGIPLLHPWANRLGALDYEAAGMKVALDPATMPLRLDANGLPIHGVATASRYWRETDRGADAERAWLAARLDFSAHPEYLAAFPYPHQLELLAELSERTLTLTTTLHAGGEGVVPVAFGWHPYLTLPGERREGWRVELPVRAHAQLDERAIPTGAVEACTIAPARLGERAFDDLYPELEPRPRFVVAGGGRSIAVQFGEGYRVAQVYAPADEQFICFEPMTAPTSALVTGGSELPLAEPGASYRAQFSISVETVAG